MLTATGETVSYNQRLKAWVSFCLFYVEKKRSGAKYEPLKKRSTVNMIQNK